MSMDEAWLDAELLRCAGDYDRFNSVILGRGRYWSRQVEVCESLKTYRTTAVKAGNGVGKSYLAAGVLLGFAVSHPNCRVVVAAPTQDQLSGVVWSEVEAAYKSAEKNGFPLGGDMKSLRYELGDNWRVEGFGSGSVESKSGRHSGDLLAIVDEASGVDPSVFEAIDSLNPSKILYLGNPLRPEGKFYEVCQPGDNPHVNVIKIPSTESPHINEVRSRFGMADKTFLEDSEHTYGLESQWWQSHVLAEFPNEITDGLLMAAWLEAAAKTAYAAKGDRWLGIDLGEGVGGDPSELVVRDDAGVCRDADGLGWLSSNRWGLKVVAEKAKGLCDRFGVEPTRVVYDAAGVGADFDNRLRSAGVVGARAYKGSHGGGDRYFNLRSAAHWLFRRRMNPSHQVKGLHGNRPIWVPQAPFALPRELLDKYRAELTGCRYSETPGGEIMIEQKDVFKKRLKKSPNFLDALVMTYAFPYA